MIKEVSLYSENNYSDEDIKAEIMDKRDYFDKAEDYKEEEDEIDDDMIIEERAMLQGMDMDDLTSELKAYLTKNCDYVIVSADIGTWQGRVDSYKVMNVEDFQTIFCNCDMISVTDRNGEFKVRGVHHDGVNYLTLRMIKKTIPYVYEKQFPMFGREYHETGALIWRNYTKRVYYAKRIFGLN